MAKNILRKMMALALAIMLCATQVVLPALAAEETTIETDANGGTTTTTTTTNSTTSTDDSTGTTTQVDSSSQTVHYTNASGSEQTQDDTWTEKKTESTPLPDNSTDPNQSEDNDKVVVTDTEGEEHVDYNVIPQGGGTEKSTVTVEGKESTTTTTTTTNVTTTDNASLGDVTLQDDPAADPKKGTETTTSQTGQQPTDTTDPGWTEGSSSSTGFVQDANSYTSTVTEIVVDFEDQINGDVTLNMNRVNANGTVAGSASDSKMIVVSSDAELKEAMKAAGFDVSQATVIEGVLTMPDGSTIVSETDENGNVVKYTITKITPISESKPTEVTPEDPADTENVQTGSKPRTYTLPTLPEGYSADDKDVAFTDAENNPGTRTVTPYYDENGVQIGYVIEETVTRPLTDSTDYNSSAVQEALKDTTSTNLNGTDGTTRIVTAEPSIVPTKTENGITTTQTLEYLYENGEHVGYKVTTTSTAADGSMVESSSESSYFEIVTTSSKLEILPDTDLSKEVITTTTILIGTVDIDEYTTTTDGTIVETEQQNVEQEVFQFVELDGGMYLAYQGKLLKVEAITGNGVTDMTTLQPNQTNLDWCNGKGNGHGDTTGDYSIYTDLRVHSLATASGDPLAGYQFKYTGYGLESNFRIESSTSKNWLAHQFELTGPNNQKYYVLCADHEVDANLGASYNMVNVNDGDYFTSKEALMVEAIAKSGYWGTDSGIGSLAAVQEFLRKSNSGLTEEEILSLTAGQALTATQAAIWKFGNSGGATFDDDVAGTVGVQCDPSRWQNDQYWYSPGGYWATNRVEMDSQDAKIINALYKALISQTPGTASNSTEILDENNFATSAQLVIKDQATDDKGNAKKDSKGNIKYNTELTFSLDVKKSDITNNLIVKVYDTDGIMVAERQIVTDESTLLGKVLAGDEELQKVSVGGTDGALTVTLTGLELAEGGEFNLVLDGFQELKTGAYLFSAATTQTSQTFVGVASGKRDVNLKATLRFDVTDPGDTAKLQHTSSSWTETNVTTRNFTKETHFANTIYGEQSTSFVSRRALLFGQTILTNIEIQEIKSVREWNNYYEYLLTTISDEDGNAQGDNAGIIIPDEEVPLAAVAITGDISMVYALVTLISLSAAALLAWKVKVF